MILDLYKKELHVSLNTDILNQQTGKDPIYGQSLVNPIGQFSELPMDVVPIIFQNLKADLPAIALVCKKWKAIADDEQFRKMIRPVQAFGTQEWQNYIGGVYPGKEPILPRRAYGDLEKG